MSSCIQSLLTTDRPIDFVGRLKELTCTLSISVSEGDYLEPYDPLNSILVHNSPVNRPKSEQLQARMNRLARMLNLNREILPFFLSRKGCSIASICSGYAVESMLAKQKLTSLSQL